MALLEPRMAVLDETDSGLDIDALKVVSEGVSKLAGPDMGVLLITHYQRMLNYIKPDFVHIMVDGRIVESGGPELAHELEAEGYDAFLPEAVGRCFLMTTSETEVVADIGNEYKYGFHDPETTSSSRSAA